MLLKASISSGRPQKHSWPLNTTTRLKDPLTRGVLFNKYRYGFRSTVAEGHHIWGTWAPKDFGIRRGSGAGRTGPGTDSVLSARDTQVFKKSKIICRFSPGWGSAPLTPHAVQEWTARRPLNSLVEYAQPHEQPSLLGQHSSLKTGRESLEILSAAPPSIKFTVNRLPLTRHPSKAWIR